MFSKNFSKSFTSGLTRNVKRGTQVTSVADLRADLSTDLYPAFCFTYQHKTPKLSVKKQKRNPLFLFIKNVLYSFCFVFFFQNV